MKPQYSTDGKNLIKTIQVSIDPTSLKTILDTLNLQKTNRTDTYTKESKVLTDAYNSDIADVDAFIAHAQEQFDNATQLNLPTDKPVAPPDQQPTPAQPADSIQP